MKVVEEYHWMITQVAEQLCCSHLSSIVMDFGFQLGFLVYTRKVDHLNTMSWLVQNSTCPYLPEYNCCVKSGRVWCWFMIHGLIGWSECCCVFILTITVTSCMLCGCYFFVGTRKYRIFFNFTFNYARHFSNKTCPLAAIAWMMLFE